MRIITRIQKALSNDEYCQQLLAYYEIDAANTVASIGEREKESYNDSKSPEQECEMEEVYASSVSDPDYTDGEGLPLLSVTSAIQKMPRIRVSGIIDTVRKPFKLLTKGISYAGTRNVQGMIESRIIFTRYTHILVTDIPIAFEGGADEYNSI